MNNLWYFPLMVLIALVGIGIGILTDDVRWKPNYDADLYEIEYQDFSLRDFNEIIMRMPVDMHQCLYSLFKEKGYPIRKDMQKRLEKSTVYVNNEGNEVRIANEDYMWQASILPNHDSFSIGCTEKGLYKSDRLTQTHIFVDKALIRQYIEKYDAIQKDLKNDN